MTKTDQEAGLARSWNRIQRDSSRETARLCAQIAESKPSKSRARSSPKNKTIMDPLPGYSSMHALLSSHETSIQRDSGMVRVHSPMPEQAGPTYVQIRTSLAR
jgi:hypothetical protein